MGVPVVLHHGDHPGTTGRHFADAAWRAGGRAVPLPRGRHLAAEEILDGEHLLWVESGVTSYPLGTWALDRPSVGYLVDVHQHLSTTLLQAQLFDVAFVATSACSNRPRRPSPMRACSPRSTRSTSTAATTTPWSANASLRSAWSTSTSNGVARRRRAGSSLSVSVSVGSSRPPARDGPTTDSSAATPTAGSDTATRRSALPPPCSSSASPSHTETDGARIERLSAQILTPQRPRFLAGHSNSTPA
jgi:hypothetical protein